MNKAVESVFGPCISGDSIDVQGNMILTGSYREKNALEIYDMRNFKKLCDINTKTKGGDSLNYISSCQFG